MQLTDASLEQSAARSQAPHLQLEFAYLYLMDEFRKAYISDQIQRESRVYEKLNQTLGIIDDSSVLKLYAQKMCVLCE